MNERLAELYRGVAVHATADAEHRAALELLALVMLADDHIDDSEVDVVRRSVPSGGARSSRSRITCARRSMPPADRSRTRRRPSSLIRSMRRSAAGSCARHSSPQLVTSPARTTRSPRRKERSSPKWPCASTECPLAQRPSAHHVRRSARRHHRRRQSSLDGPFSGAFGGVHLLPFYVPIDGSDAGFDPSDHTAVDPRVGDWVDVRRLGVSLDVMADLIVNHVSADSDRFADWRCRGEASPYAPMFLSPERVSGTRRPRRAARGLPAASDSVVPRRRVRRRVRPVRSGRRSRTNRSTSTSRATPGGST